MTMKVTITKREREGKRPKQVRIDGFCCDHMARMFPGGVVNAGDGQLFVMGPDGEPLCANCESAVEIKDETV